MVNLLSNAVKYSGENKPVALLAVHGDRELAIDITDQGIGIGTDDQLHLFERFFRGENATNIQGTGLGLNIVANYVELLGGLITFESELNKGSTFRVRIPLHDGVPRKWQ
jgi:signal transduction histidine kinase